MHLVQLRDEVWHLGRGVSDLAELHTATHTRVKGDGKA